MSSRRGLVLGVCGGWLLDDMGCLTHSGRGLIARGRPALVGRLWSVGPSSSVCWARRGFLVGVVHDTFMPSYGGVWRL